MPLPDELGRGQLVDRGATDGRIEAPVEILEGPQLVELSGLGAPFDEALLAHVEFVLQEQFEELRVGELMGGRFLEPQFQAGEQPGEQQFAGGVWEGVIHRRWVRGCG